MSIAKPVRVACVSLRIHPDPRCWKLGLLDINGRDVVPQFFVWTEEAAFIFKNHLDEIARCLNMTAPKSCPKCKSEMELQHVCEGCGQREGVEA
jgi:hypothetical protein